MIEIDLIVLAYFLTLLVIEGNVRIGLDAWKTWYNAQNFSKEKNVRALSRRNFGSSCLSAICLRRENKIAD